jgi:hypothetical protein
MRLRPDDQKLLSLLMRWQALRAQKPQGGYALVAVIFISIVLLGLLTAYALSTKVETTSSSASVDSTSGYYTAEGGLNMRAMDLLRAFQNNSLPSGSSPAAVADCLDGNTSNNGTGDFGCRNYEFGNSLLGVQLQQRRTATTYVVTSNRLSGGIPQANIVTIPPGQEYAGMTVQEYTYQLYSVTQKQAANLQTEAILQMNIRARFLPLFQFAAFYENDLEMSSSSRMNLNGRVHTNASFFYVGGWNRESDTTMFTQIDGQVTVACPNPDRPAPNPCPTSGDFNGGGLFNTMKENPAYNNTDGKAQVARASGGWISIKSAGNATATPYRVDPAVINVATGGRVRIGSNFGIQPLTRPPTSTLDRNGDFNSRADLRIEYRPGLVVPFEVRRSDPNSLMLPRTDAEVFDLTSMKGAGVLHSLRQPVLASAALSSVTDQYAVCPYAPVATPNTPALAALATPLSTDQKNAAIFALQVAIASTPTPIPFSQLQTTSQPVTAVVPAFSNILSNNSEFSDASHSAARAAVAALTPNQIAALNGGSQRRCFVPPPIQEVKNFRNDRENRLINMIQINIGSLAIWNRDGVYVNYSGGSPITPVTGVSTDQLLYLRAGADTSAPAGTFQNLGYAAQDATDNGMAIYATINRANYPYPDGESPYGFAITGGKQLFGLARTANNPEPTGLSVITDQAVYVQGNYNSTRNLASMSLPEDPSQVKQPAAIMADTLNVLSNRCINSNFQIQKDKAPPSSPDYDLTARLNCTPDGVKTAPTLSNEGFTAINSAFLAATDQSLAPDNGNGGLNNFPRTHEDWALTVPLFIRGSFVSLSYPVHVSGRIRGRTLPVLIRQNDIFTPPKREWDYDKDFNLVSNLPPLTPTVRWVRQDIFQRRFNR